MKLGESFFWPAWLVSSTLTVPQYYGFWAKEKSPEKMGSHAELVERSNRIRAKKGLPPVPDREPTHEFVNGAWRQIPKKAELG